MLVRIAGILAAPIRVMQKTFSRFLLQRAHLQSITCRTSSSSLNPLRYVFLVVAIMENGLMRQSIDSLSTVHLYRGKPR